MTYAGSSIALASGRMKRKWKEDENEERVAMELFLRSGMKERGNSFDLYPTMTFDKPPF